MKKAVKNANGRAALLALAVLGVSQVESADVDRFKGGSYDGYAKQDTETLAIPAAPKKGTMIRVM